MKISSALRRCLWRPLCDLPKISGVMNGVHDEQSWSRRVEPTVDPFKIADDAEDVECKIRERLVSVRKQTSQAQTIGRCFPPRWGRAPSSTERLRTRIAPGVANRTDLGSTTVTSVSLRRIVEVQHTFCRSQKSRVFSRRAVCSRWSVY